MTAPPSDLRTLLPADRLAAVAGGCALTIGNFDGVHVGHQAILAEARAWADERGLPVAALTFEPHPVSVFRGQPADTFRLTTNATREALLEASGVDVVLTVPFDKSFAALTAESFVQDLVVDTLHARRAHVGWDFNFGARRSGNTDTLQRLGDALGLEVHVHSAVELDGAPISSTRVRTALRRGDLDLVESLLGRPWFVEGTTEAGAGRGEGIGIPTVNLYPRDIVTPTHGVYATRLTLGGRTWAGISNLGVRPTFDDGDERVSLETMVLEPFEVEARGVPARVELLSFIRDERTFDGPDALKAQIQQDVAAARAEHARRGMTAPDA